MPPLRLLLAEDNRLNQMVAIGILKKAGHSVEVAADGRQVLDRLQEGGVDAVLMDVEMPNMDGLQATKEIRRQEADDGPRLPIIGLTAHAADERRQLCLEAGMDAFASKPLQADALLATLRQVVGSA